VLDFVANRINALCYNLQKTTSSVTAEK